MRQTLRVTDTRGMVAAFGVIGHSATKECMNFVIGEKEIPDSIGCVIAGNTVAIMFKDDIIFKAETQIAVQPEISVIFKDGRLRFELNGRNLDCDKLKELNFATGQFRLGVSLVEAGQTAELLHLPMTLHGQDDPDAVATLFNPSAVPSIVFQDRLRSIDVLNGNSMICRQTTKGTVFSQQIVIGGVNSRHTFRILEKGAGILAFGVLGARSTRQCADYVLGEKEIPDSVGCVIRANELAIAFKDDVIFNATVAMPTQPEVSIIFENGRLRFEFDGKNLKCDALAALNFGTGTFRIGVSLTEQGQQVAMTTGGGGVAAAATSSAPAGPTTGLAEDVIEGDQDIMYKWVFTESDAVRTGATINSKDRGAKAFSLQVIGCEKFQDRVTCDVCFKGGPSRRPFDTNRWKCKQCADFDMCNDCFHNRQVKHQHDRKDFGCTIGGSFHEMRFEISDLLGSTLDVGIVLRGQELTFGEKPELFVTGGPAGWMRSKNPLSTTPLKQGDKVWIRLFNDNLMIFCNKKLLVTTKVDQQHYRFAVRFGRDGQSLTMTNRAITPPRGTPVAVTTDTDFLEQESKLVGLDPQFMRPGVRGWIIGEDIDGTVQLNIDESEQPIWVPRTAITPLNGRTVPPPSVPRLPNGAKVVRNQACWIWGQQDGNQRGNRIGQVTATDDDNWVSVSWTSGTSNLYSYTKGLYNVLAWVGNVGDRVTRNPAFFASGAKGAYGFGTVESISGEGILHVKWDNGDRGDYRFNEEAQEVQLAGPERVPPLNDGTSAPSSPMTPPPAVSKNPTVAPPAPPVTAPPVPGDAADFARNAETQNLMDVALKPAMRLKASYKPPADLATCMRQAAAAIPRITEMDYIVDESLAIAADRRMRHGDHLALDESLAIALYTFDLGTMCDQPDGSDNFYFQMNEVFRSRDNQALLALQPFMYHFKMAWNKLPNVTGTFYRGVPKSALSILQGMYTQGREVYWSSITSLSVDRDVARKFSLKEGPGGVLMEVNVVDSRSISQYSAIPREGEVILEPNTRLVVMQAVTTADGVNVMKLLQVKQEKAFVF
jgi:hypothetical protein